MVHITISPPGPRDPASRATTGPAGLAWEKKQAKEKWQQNYADLNSGQKKAIREIYPQKISEAEPKKYGEKK